MAKQNKQNEAVSLLRKKTNNDKINDLTIESKAKLFNNFNVVKCLCCSYHYEKDECHTKSCEEGFKSWLGSEVNGDWITNWT